MHHAAHFLPGQGPIGVFIHHNTLHAFEHLPFADALAEASAKFAAEPFPSEGEFRSAYARGRVLERDLDAVLERELGMDAHGVAIGEVTRAELRKHALLWLDEEPLDAALAWRLEEGRLFDDLRGRVVGDVSVVDLWNACRARFARPRRAPRKARPRLCDALFDVTGQDPDSFVHPSLIRLCAAFLDQGVAYWPMPGREHGLFRAAQTLIAQPGPPPNPWIEQLVAETERQVARGVGPLDLTLEILADLGLQRDQWPTFIESTLLVLPGWAGMMHQLEQRPDRAPVHAPPTSLLDFLALRLSLEREACRFIASVHGLPNRSLSALWESVSSRRRPDPPVSELASVHDAFVVLAHAGVTPSDVLGLTPEAAAALIDELDDFDSFARRRVWLLAYELRHAHEVLDPLAAHSASPVAAPEPKFQVVFCIDERAESLRRHLEEICPEVETWGTAGFFGVPMYYQGIDDAHAIPLCPIAITPKHLVHEQVIAGASERLVRRRAQRRWAGRFAQGADVGSRTFLRGTIWSAALGMLTAVPLVMRVLFPRSFARFGRGVRELSLPKLETRLDLERHGDERTPDGRWLGFSVDEMTAIVRGVLEDMGMRTFAPLVLIVGHGSSSLNNPHESAHDCGACGGGRGGPNARAFAQMANHPAVRERLRALGIDIPDSTWFLGAYHDTCSDAISYFDLARVPATLRERMGELSAALERASALDAHERCRRFESASLTLDPLDALHHVEARADDLAQPRPEYGHATNAVAVIGRRARTRGLFLDRRAFLISYDATTDPDGRLLARLLASVVPVGAGINLEYYFSYVDPVRFGCGTKLPHNITGLVGVMDGYSSDLRTGLPWQMVEIHEPVRLLVVIEAKPELIASAAAESPHVWRLVRNDWLRVVALDPESATLSVFQDGSFRAWEPEACVLPVVERSVGWYGGRREHLPPARVRASIGASP